MEILDGLGEEILDGDPGLGRRSWMEILAWGGWRLVIRADSSQSPRTSGDLSKNL
jgi:hypothetical protein